VIGLNGFALLLVVGLALVAFLLGGEPPENEAPDE
jgi:hypothetical protein